MSPPEVWGPAVWTLFHTLIEKVNDQAYPFIKVQLFGQIRRICGFLPCPECSADATNFLAKVNINDLKTKVDFRNTFYLFHNMVNAKKRKRLFNYGHITSYNNYSIVPVINNFISKYNTKGNMKLIAESFQRKLVLGEFKSWFTKTIRAFTPPQNVPSPISLIVNDSVSVTEEESTITTEVVISLVSIEEPTITTEDAAIITEEIAITESEVTVEELAITFVEEITESEAATEEEEIVVTEEESTITESESTITTEEESTITTEDTAILTEEVV